MSVDTLNPANGAKGIHAMGGGVPQIQEPSSASANGNSSSGSSSAPAVAPPAVEGGDEDAIAENVGSEVNITINNTMCTFSVRCHLNLRDIALRGANVEFRKEYQNVLMRLRRPMATATMWSSGKVTVTGAPSEELAKIASRKFARRLQKLGYQVRFTRFKVSNVLGTCSLPFGLKLTQFAQHFKEEASYEPELHPGATFKMKHLKASLKVYQTGSITVTAPSTNNVQQAIEAIYPLVYNFQKPKLVSDLKCPIPQAPETKGKKRKLLKRPAAAYPLIDQEEEEGSGANANGVGSVPMAAVSQKKRRKKAVQHQRRRDDDSDVSDPSAESSDDE